MKLPLINNRKLKTELIIIIEHFWSVRLFQVKHMLKILSRIPDRDIYIITKSPPEQYSNSKVKIKEISDEIKPVNGYENAIIDFDFLGSSNSRFIDQFFIRDRHNILDIYYLSQSYFICQKELQK